MAEFDPTFIECIKGTRLLGIKAGSDRPNFLEIWMVTVEDRVFARSWGLAERSWYNSFLQNNKGEMRCGEKIVKITAIVPPDLEKINDKISEAYLKKYDHGENSYYAHGIVKKEHLNKTMEFICS